MEILNVNNLSLGFKSENGIRPVLKNVSFSINEGEVLGIVGESGSGKSVSSMAIMRLLPENATRISSGSINFTEKSGSSINLLSITENQMQKLRGNQIAMIFQEPMTSLNPVKRCGEQVVEALLLHKAMTRKQAKERTIELFAEVLLPRPKDIFYSYPHQISGGQKQRVMIAMAISCEPRLLIADEPTTALDVTVQKTILEILKNLQKKYGLSVIFITHDLGVVAQIAQKVVVLYQGEVVEQGEVEKIFYHPAHPYTKGLLACRPPQNKRFEKLPTISDFVSVKEDSKEFKFIEINELERKKHQNTMYSQPPMLEIKNLQTSFPIKKNFFGRILKSLKAVDDVSFEVYRGETLGLVGESGCGKTTLGRTLLRMVESGSGSILLDGNDISSFDRRQMLNFRRRMQIIFQDPYSSLNPRMSIGQAILEPMEVHHIGKNQKERKAKVIELLERVSLGEEHFNRYPHEFSGGQRQRVVIARTLAMQPEFIVCDESVSALDVSVQAQVLNLLNELKADFGFTYIFISHDLSVVRFMSDRLIVMKEGKIIEAGNADNIYANPKEEYTKRLIAAIPRV